MAHRERSWFALGALAMGAVIGVVALITHGRRPERVSDADARASAAPDAPEPTQRRSERTARKPRAQPFLVRPAELYEPKDQELEEAYRKQQSQELVGLLFFRLAAFEATHPNELPEAAANEFMLYQRGLADGLRRTAPEIEEQLGEQVESTFCDVQAKPSRQLMLANLAAMMPQLMTAKGVDCIAQRGKEDIVLWAVLDAWQAAGMPEAPGIAQIKRVATDSRTLTRLEAQNPPAIDEIVQRPSTEGDGT